MLTFLQVPSLAAVLQHIAERCLPLPRVPAAAVAAAATDGGKWRGVEAALRDLGGIAAEGAGASRGPSSCSAPCNHAGSQCRSLCVAQHTDGLLDRTRSGTLHHPLLDGRARHSPGQHSGAEPAAALASQALRHGDGDADAEGGDQRPAMSSSYAPCRVLLAAGPDAGQERVAGALLRLLDGCAVHTVSLPALLTAGARDSTFEWPQKAPQDQAVGITLG